MAPQRLARFILAAFFGAFFGTCAKPAEAAAPKPTDAARAGLEVLFSPCDVAAGVCTLKPASKLVLWVAAAPGWTIEIKTPPGWSHSEPRAAAGGWHYEVEVASDGELVVAARDNVTVTWQLTIERAPRPASLDGLETLIADGASSAVLAQFAASAAAHDPANEGMLFHRLAQLLYARGEDPLPALDRSLAALQQDQGISALIFAATMASRVLLDRGEIQRAAKIIEAIPGKTATWPAAARYLHHIHRARFADRLGDFATAAALAQRALRVAERMRLAAPKRYGTRILVATDLLARQLRRLGEHTSADALFANIAWRLEEGASIGCGDRSKLLTNLAWDRMTVFDLGDSAAKPLPLLRESLEILEDESCSIPKRAEQKLGRYLDMARARTQRGEHFMARVLLDRAERMTIQPRRVDALWLAVVEAHWGLGVGHLPAAIEASDRVEQLAGSIFADEARLAVAPIRAQAHAQQGDLDVAIAALQQAEHLLETRSRRLLPHASPAQRGGLGVGSTQMLIDLLLRNGQIEEALLTVLRSRARQFRHLDLRTCTQALTPHARQQWETAVLANDESRMTLDAREQAMLRRPLDEQKRYRPRLEEDFEATRAALDAASQTLRASCTEATAPTTMAPTTDGQLVLAYHVLPSGWVAFAANARGIGYTRLEDLEPQASAAELSDRLLAPFHDKIVQAKAKRIHILPSGALESVDFHALPFAEAALLDIAPVVYGFGLSASVAADSSTPTALVIGDTRRDLPQAHAASAGVAQSLGVAGFDTVLLRHDEPSRTAVLEAFGNVDRLHFAGHGEVDDTTGESTLLLAGRDTLTIGDLLLAERVPRHVVLLACSAANVLGPTPIARVMLARGADTVVASTRTVTDRAAATFSSTFYQVLNDIGDEAIAVQRAQIAVRDQHPSSDWASFRILVRHRPTH